MKIAFLGLGKMGSAIAHHLLKSGNEMTVWNRTIAHADPLGREGAKVAKSGAEAVADAEVVFSMVMDDGALEDVLYKDGVLDKLAQGAIHISLSTISVQLSKKLTEEHRKRGQQFLAAPVFGRPHVADAGKLWVAAAGPKEAIEKVRPLLEQFSRGITVVGEHPWSGHAMKLGGNFLITQMIAGLTEALIYAEAMEIEPETFVETANKAMFQSPFYEMYGKIMLHPPEKPGGTIALGAKDMRLFREAAHSANVETPLADLYMKNFHRAIEAGMKDQDWAAGYLQLQKGTAGK